MMGRVRIPFGAAFTILCLSGCASTRLTQEPGLVAMRDSQGAHPALPKITVVLYTRQLRFDTPVDTYVSPHRSKRSTQQKLDRVAHEFPFLQAQGAPDAVATPYRLTIEATHATGGNKKLSWISSMTKYLIPSTEHAAVELEARLLRDGTLMKTYEATGTCKTRKHLLFLLAPWMWGVGTAGDTTADTFRDLFLQIEQDAGTLS